MDFKSRTGVVVLPNGSYRCSKCRREYRGLPVRDERSAEGMTPSFRRADRAASRSGTFLTMAGQITRRNRLDNRGMTADGVRR